MTFSSSVCSSQAVLPLETWQAGGRWESSGGVTQQGWAAARSAKSAQLAAAQQQRRRRWGNAKWLGSLPMQQQLSAPSCRWSPA